MKSRPAYRDIELYEPGRVPVDVDLSDNTNLFGIAPAAREMFDAMPDAAISRYPTVFAKELKQALAERHDVKVENIVTGCGSDDVIDSAIRAFSEPGDCFAFPWPTFGVVSTFAKMNACTPLPVNNLDGLLIADAAVMYVCTPNNPTGTTVSAYDIERLDHYARGLVLLDEAYADFGDADFAKFAVQSKRTVSLRTMSKAYGLAGLRIGYAIGPADIILEIEKSRGPYKVGTVAEQVGTRVVRENEDWRRDVVGEFRSDFTAGRTESGCDERRTTKVWCVNATLRRAGRSRRMPAGHRRAVGHDGEVSQRIRSRFMKVAIFDYGTGNLHSLAKAVENAGASVSIEADPQHALESDALILPGVGAFGAASSRLAAYAPSIRAALASGHPCLGICLGMQLLFETSEEGDGSGVAALRGRVRKLHNRRVPHMGWNDVNPATDDPIFDSMDPFLAYYANSFVAEPADLSTVIAWTEYDAERFPAAVRRDMTWGVQFHPEKSEQAGLKLIHNFLDAARK